MYDIAGERYLSSKETAKRMRVTPQTLRTYRSDEREHIPFVKLGGAVLYLEADVDKYVTHRSL